MLKKIYYSVIPPGQWMIPVVILMGIITGMGIYIYIVVP